MKHMAIMVGVALSLGIPAAASAQVAAARAKADFSGTWVFNQDQSSAGSSGNAPVLPFASELVVKHTPTEFEVVSLTVRQKPVTVAYKLNGGPVTIQIGGNVSETSEARLEGSNIVITSRRSFPSPIGEVVVNFKEVWSVKGDVLTIEKSRNADLDSAAGKGLFDKKK